MEWIMTNDCLTNTKQKNILCAGPGGGVYKPNSLRISKDGEVFARVCGRELLIHAYLVYPAAPKIKRKKQDKKEKERKRITRADALEWPLNMFSDIDTEAFRGCIFLNTVPENFEKNWEQIAKNITEREAVILEMYYRHHLRLMDIAVNTDLSRERVRQIIQKALRKLSRKQIIDVLLGKTYVEDDNMQGYVSSIAIDVLDEGIFHLKPPLSVRAYNALYRAGKTTKRDILLMAESEIRNLKNVGIATGNEIIEHKERLSEQVGLKKPKNHDKIVP